jgi:hypothetical protein
MLSDDMCSTCGNKLSHWYHYYSDIYGSFLFHRCPKISLLSSQKTPKLAGGCWYYTKFILWFILIPILTLIAIVRSLFKVFQTFMFQPVHFEFSNMNRDQKCRWRIPIYLLYFLLSIVLVILEIIIPIIVTPFCLPVAYFIHIYSLVMHRRNNKNIRIYLK